MKKVYFTPGPAQLNTAVAGYIKSALDNDVCSISHRSARFKDIFKETTANVKALLDIPDNFHIFFISSATEAMERIIENCVERSSTHLVNGAFSERFYQIACDLKKEPYKIEVAPGNGFYANNLQIDIKSELICITQNETSTGVSLPPDITANLKSRYPDKLIAIDIVSSAPSVELDYSSIDCVFFSIQKGFGLPAGLGVIIANERCIQKSISLQEKGLNIGSYHNFPALLEQAKQYQTPETPNVLGIYLLGKVCEKFLHTGISEIRQCTEKKASMLYNFLDTHPLYKPFVLEKSFRSPTIIVAETSAGSAAVITKLADQGYIIGRGYGRFKYNHIRIANFPANSIDDLRCILHHLD